MGIKNIHLVLIVAAIIYFLFFGVWSLKNDHEVFADTSFLLAAATVVYCIQFIKKMGSLA